MLEWARNYPEVFDYLPHEPAEIENLHRQYLANIIFSVTGDDFKEWVDRRLKERIQKMTEDCQMNIKMDPQIYQIFKES